MPQSGQFQNAQVFLEEPQIMIPEIHGNEIDADLVDVLRTPYLTSYQPAEAISVILHQQHNLNLVQQERSQMRDEYMEHAISQGREVPQILQGRYHMTPEDYARMYSQKLKNSWVKRSWLKTLKVVDEMERMNVPLLRQHYAFIIANLTDCGEYHRAEYFFDDMIQKQVPVSADIFEKLFQGCLHANNLELTQKYLGVFSESGLAMESHHGYWYVMQLLFKQGRYEQMEDILREMHDAGHASTEDIWVLLMKAKALQGDSAGVEDLLQQAGNDDFALTTSMLNQLMRAIPAQNIEAIKEFFQLRFQDEMLNRNPETYEIIIEKLYELKDYEGVAYYYTDLMEHAVSPPNFKPTDRTFLIALKAARDNNFDKTTTELIWKDMKTMDTRRKYHPEWKKPLTMKEQRYYYIKARLDMDAEHRAIIREVRKAEWIRAQLKSLERSENNYQRRLKSAELRKVAEQGGFAYATHEDEDFIPLSADELKAFDRITRA